MKPSLAAGVYYRQLDEGVEMVLLNPERQLGRCGA
jgi:hypothetical protein